MAYCGRQQLGPVIEMQNEWPEFMAHPYADDSGTHKPRGNPSGRAGKSRPNLESVVRISLAVNLTSKS
jgi:hypothetical protein